VVGPTVSARCHQIRGPRRHLPKLSNSLCRHAGACVRFNPHFRWQATESYAERGNAFALISGHGKSLLSAFSGHHRSGDELAPLHVQLGASFPSVPSLIAGRATRWPSGRNVDRQKHDYEDQDRIKHDFRDVETQTPPLLYSVLVHGRSPSVANRSITARSACHRTAGQVLGLNLKCSESRWVPTVSRTSEGRIAHGVVAGRCTAGFRSGLCPLWVDGVDKVGNLKGASAYSVWRLELVSFSLPLLKRAATLT
jgi:hypothetical protein